MVSTSMMLRYLPTNQRWVFTFGDMLVRMDMVGRTLFETRADAVHAAKVSGLSVDSNCRVSVEHVRVVACRVPA